MSYDNPRTSQPLLWCPQLLQAQHCRHIPAPAAHPVQRWQHE
jgi:hypothetical protein